MKHVKGDSDEIYPLELQAVPAHDAKKRLREVLDLILMVAAKAEERAKEPNSPQSDGQEDIPCPMMNLGHSSPSAQSSLQAQLDALLDLKRTVKSHFPTAWPALESCLSAIETLRLQDVSDPTTLIQVGTPASLKTTTLSFFDTESWHIQSEARPDRPASPRPAPATSSTAIGDIGV